jgi:adenylyltransferase/sulfurtransferase
MKQISYAQLQAWSSEGRGFQLLDVRETSEREAFHIGGIHIPLGELISRKGELPQGQPVVVYCKRGIRSQIAIQRLAGHFPEVDFHNLQGGVYRQMN